MTASTSEPGAAWRRAPSGILEEHALQTIAAASVARFGQDAALRTAEPVRVRFVEP